MAGIGLDGAARREEPHLIVEQAMRRPVRPFIVEVKNKRAGGSRKERSIWGDVDLAAIAAEAMQDFEKKDPANGRLIDSDPLSIDVAMSHNLQAEPHMADPREAETVEILAEAPAEVETSEPKGKRKAAAPRKPGPKRARGEKAARPAAKAAAVPAPTARTARKVHSRQERAQKLDQIEKAVMRGASLRSAVRQAGIADQTYYQWKKDAGSSAPAGDLKDLVALEEENRRLKQLLAERLRKENAELKKKLGLE